MNSFDSKKTSIKLEVRDLAIDYGQTPVLSGVNLEVYSRTIREYLRDV